MKRESVLFNYLNKNRKSFIKIIIIFFLGIVLGIIFINNISSSQISEINNYVSKLINNIKNSEDINKVEILTQSIKQNVSFLLIVWFLGCTIIGSGLIYIAIIYKGFSLGYTIAVIVACLNAKSAIIFILASLVIQNIIFLPTFFILAESGMKLYKVTATNYIDIKSELIRYSLIMLISVILAILSSYAEVYISTNLLILLKSFL